MRFTLRQLEIFMATAKYQNVSMAAEALYMSQSAASAALSQIEKQFDIKLFERTGKSLKLSNQGHAVLDQAQQLMDQAARFEDLLSDNLNAGHIKVGASLTIGNYLGVKLYSEYLQNFPKAQTEFKISNSPDIVNKVVNYEIDVGLIEFESHHPDLELIPWRSDRLIACCAPHHPQAKKPELLDEDILANRWIIREAESGTRQTFNQAMGGLIHRLNIYLELDHNEAIKRAVEAGLGLGCMSEIAVESNFKHGDLVPLHLKHRTLRRQFYFALNKHKQRSPAVQNWIELCLNSNQIR